MLYLLTILYLNTGVLLAVSLICPALALLQPDIHILNNVNTNTDIKRIKQDTPMYKRQTNVEDSTTRKATKRNSLSDSMNKANRPSKLPRLNIGKANMRRDHQVLKPVPRRIHSSLSPSSPAMQKINELKDLMDAPIPEHSAGHAMHLQHSPSTWRVQELHHLITAPPSPAELKQRESRSHSPVVRTSTYKRPASPTTKRVNELHHLITSPPTMEELKERECRSHSPAEGVGTNHGEPLAKAHRSSSDARLFSDDVIRRGSRGTAAFGYRTNRNTIALAAETLIKKEKTRDHDEAIGMAKQKLLDRKAAAQERKEEWRKLATNNPEKAGERKQSVPKNLSRDIYVPARAYQLQAHGKAKTFEEGKKIANAEQDKIAAGAKIRDGRRRAKQALKSPR
ncbi:uncharacterized protein FA14DRAFT_171185 [Meira miltonrushii]|uniref:Uncharacterized protein n=1 Tax=Meira miltonrushii TaxID=1280837 RepID=A0A316VMH7_9BASI|nr:uncharacterized protein FA14DRAFT_171185 [Meira miltonrushii]PWN38510.1 hypothetical protein FA14DRAFT_171185 [Meira miltonrushii]